MALNGLVGCFAMTELGHGSNVAGLETTSTFDSASDQFIINTPTITGTKWWIGGAAHTATHWYATSIGSMFQSIMLTVSVLQG